MSVLSIAIIVLFLSAAALCLAVGLSLRVTTLQAHVRVMTLAAAACLTAAFALRWVVAGHMPALGVFENALGAAWFVSLGLVAMDRGMLSPVVRREAAPGFALWVTAIAAFGMSLGYAPTAVPPVGWSWLSPIPSVLLWLSVAALLAVSTAAASGLVRPAEDTSAEDDGLIARGTGVGFALLTLAVSATALASYLGGSVWFTWGVAPSLVVAAWLVYAIVVHVVVSFGWRGGRLARLLMFALPFLVAAFCAWSVYSGRPHDVGVLASVVNL